VAIIEPEGIGTVGDPRAPVFAQAGATSGLALLLDPESGEFVLTGIQVDDAFTELAAECPVASERLGQLNPQTTVARLTIDCADVRLPSGGTGPVTGTIVVDVVSRRED
jgi:hypothetical protein